jgi:hypothetical protein
MSARVDTRSSVIASRWEVRGPDVSSVGTVHTELVWVNANRDLNQNEIWSFPPVPWSNMALGA